MSAFLECMKDQLLEILALGAIAAILEMIKRYGLRYAAREGGKLLLKTILKKYLPKLTWIGQAVTIALILFAIAECAGWLP